MKGLGSWRLPYVFLLAGAVTLLLFLAIGAYLFREMQTSGSGGIGAVSFGCGELLIELFLLFVVILAVLLGMRMWLKRRRGWMRQAGRTE